MRRSGVKEGYKQLGIMVPVTDLKRLRFIALKKDVNVSVLIRKLIRDFIKEESK